MTKEEEQAMRETIRLNIIYYRKQARLSQKDLAQRVNLKESSISAWESGRSLPDIATLWEICQIFGVTLNQMYGIEEQKTDPIDNAIEVLQRLKEGGANEEP